MEAPKEIKIQQMPLKYKKFFATFIMGGASFTAFRQEHLRILKKDVSRSTYARIKRDSKKILETVTHREKKLSYRTENDTEKRERESHVPLVQSYNFQKNLDSNLFLLFQWNKLGWLTNLSKLKQKQWNTREMTIKCSEKNIRTSSHIIALNLGR